MASPGTDISAAPRAHAPPVRIAFAARGLPGVSKSRPIRLRCDGRHLAHVTDAGPVAIDLPRGARRLSGRWGYARIGGIELAGLSDGAQLVVTTRLFLGLGVIVAIALAAAFVMPEPTLIGSVGLVGALLCSIIGLQLVPGGMYQLTVRR